jgi:glucose-6-phosphate isomerase
MNASYLNAVSAVKARASLMPKRVIADLVANEARLNQLSLDCAGIYLDLHRSPVDEADWASLLDLARHAQVESKRDAMLAGEIMNPTEGRRVWHTMLRATALPQFKTPAQQAQQAAAVSALAEVQSTLANMRALCQEVRAEGRIQDVVHIGIGGSYLGPELLYQSLRGQGLDSAEHGKPLRVHFVANVDPYAWARLENTLDPTKTLVILASKSWTTPETALNAKAVKLWFAKAQGSGQLSIEQVAKQWIAVTAKPELARADGIPSTQILPFADWVGGRFSLWSAIGMPIMLAYGEKVFDDLLRGAREMDQHFASAPLESNGPVLMAMLSLWQQLHLGSQTEAVIPYAQRLARLPAFLQQLQMESNGKRVDLEGLPLTLPSSPVIWGEPATDSQHSFFQALHHSPQIQAIDFVLVQAQDDSERARFLNANALAQIQALSLGHASSDPHRHYPGNRPCNVLVLKQVDARSLGALLALYEHKTAALGWLLNINSFDQFGVELGKVIAKQFNDLLDPKNSLGATDLSSARLIERLRPT